MSLSTVDPKRKELLTRVDFPIAEAIRWAAFLERMSISQKISSILQEWYDRRVAEGMAVAPPQGGD